MNEVDALLLEHFGTKGMKWGVRKSPEEKQSRRDVKAKKFEDKAKVLEKEITKVQGSKSIFKNITLRELQKEKESALDDAQRKREGKLSKRQKKIVIGASATAAIVASYVTYQSLNSGNARRLSEKGKDFILKRKGPAWKINPELADKNLGPNEVMSKVVKHINPNYGATGTKMNCRRATYAYEMRRRGYDVAATRTSNGRGQDITGVFNVLSPTGTNLVPPGPSGIATRVISELRKPDKPFTEMGSSVSHLGQKLVDPGNIVSELSLQPNGARGELGVVWSSGGGHSIAWEKINGIVEIFDNQTGHRYSDQDKILLPAKIKEAGFTRLDNLPLNDDFLRRWLKDA